jgi:hypothetical protein
MVDTRKVWRSAPAYEGPRDNNDLVRWQEVVVEAVSGASVCL